MNESVNPWDHSVIYAKSMPLILRKYFAGYYCDNSGLTAPRGLCSQGYYCPAGQNVSAPPDYACTPGHFCPDGSPTQLACSPGTYQDEFTKVIDVSRFSFC